ncbi:MAG TPA: response regulator [Bacteroidales bacterium]|nr:response regulator [Bacteroidales bacterium]
MNEDYFGKYEWQNKTILIVEDDLSSSFFLKEILLETEANLLFAADGREAIEVSREHPEIDVVLMDIQLPLLNGYETTREIKKIYPELPVIAQTAYAFQSDKEKCFEAGCIDYITKPIETTLLLDKIADVINHGT